MDIRIKRTKEMLCDSLLELLKVQPLEKITPTSLCKKATINRNTFYSHYKSTNDLFEEIENDCLQKVDEAITESKNPIDAITAICSLLKNNKRLSNLLFTKNAGTKIVKKAFDLSNKFNMSKMNNESNELSDIHKEMLSSFTIKGSSAALECWVKSGMKEEPREIAEFIYKISKNGSNSVTK